MKKLLLCLSVGLLSAACSKDQPVQMTGAPAAPVSAAKPAGPAKCGPAYAESLRACASYVCTENTPEGTVTRTVKGLEEGACVETVVTEPKPAQTAAAPNAVQTEPQISPEKTEQTCRFTEEQRGQMADYLALYFASGGKVTVSVQTNEEGQPVEIASAGGNVVPAPLNAFLQSGVCTRPGFSSAEKKPAVTCTGTQAITVITVGEDGQEISETVQCEP